MTAADPATPPFATRDSLPMTVVPRTLWDHVEDLLERIGEYVNPILVKEARQALKSKQFVITFTLVLVCGWGWSLLGVALMGQDVYYAPIGPFMLMGYFWVLAFPLILIVPFAAFRSLASEREDGTYELLSITTLWPRQIIAGKLGSSILQMLVYLSALAPCIAFTYLLRGMDIISIMLFVIYTFLVSLLLSMAGLLVATVSKAKHWQIVLSVLMILALAAVYLFGSWTVSMFLSFGETMPIDRVEFWIAQAAIVSGGLSFFVLLFLAAAARISFASDNRSTKLRIMMLVQQALLTGWIMFFLLWVQDTEVLFAYVMIAAIYWGITGAIMCGENPQLSQRVKRSLPQSLLARTLLTWFNPGPGTGFIFVTCNILGVLLLAVVAGLELELHTSTTLPSYLQDPIWHVFALAWCVDFHDQWLQFSVLSCCYVICYLGVGRLIIMLARRVARVGLFVSLLLHKVLVLLGTLAPLVMQLSLLFEENYTFLQITNPFWTLYETMRNGGDILSHTVTVLIWNIPVVPTVLIGSAALLLLVNLVAASGEAVHERQAAPERVQEDEKALHPERFDRPVKLSPWDDEPAGKITNGEAVERAKGVNP